MKMYAWPIFIVCSLQAKNMEVFIITIEKLFDLIHRSTYKSFTLTNISVLPMGKSFRPTNNKKDIKYSTLQVIQIPELYKKAPDHNIGILPNPIRDFA